ncbi:MAG: CatB-related O-acetyltransferase [Pseudomonadota bacterium]
MPYPSPDTPNPVTLPDGSTLPNNVFLKAVIDHPRIEVGDYTYANAFTVPEDWAAHIAPFMFPTSQDRLIIGKFGQFADGARFITQSANHRRDGFSTYPFAIHDPDRFMAYPGTLPRGKDTVVGHDVWLGKDVSVMPGTRIGSGVIVGSGAVVAGTIPDYAVVVGNPGRVVRLRFDPDTIVALLQIAWWDWPIDAILDAEAAICGADLDALRAAAP